jgi:hypothetical protein
MELEDPSVKRAFVKYVLSLQDPDHPLLTETMASTLVTLLTQKFRYLPGGKKTLFSVSVGEAANLLQVEPGEIVRIITGREGHSSRTAHEFKYGVDFVTNGRGNPKGPTSRDTSRYFFLMTPGCFARAAMQLSTGVQIRQYFNLVDRGLRDQMGESLWKRLQIEDPTMTTIKEMHQEFIPFGNEPGTYDIEFRDKYGNESTYFGVTNDMNTRFQSHKANIAGVPVKVHYKKDIYPLSIEQIRHRYSAQSQLAIPEDQRGFRDLVVTSPETKFVKELSEIGTKAMDLAYARKHGRTPLPATVFPKSDMYPRKRVQKKRRNSHNWQDGAIVRYDAEGKDPTVVQYPPNIQEYTLQELQHEEASFEQELENPTLSHVTKQILDLPTSTRKQYIRIQRKSNGKKKLSH